MAIIRVACLQGIWTRLPLEIRHDSSKRLQRWQNAEDPRINRYTDTRADTGAYEK